jgi:c(7)-type cytochrome triheme protein
MTITRNTLKVLFLLLAIGAGITGCLQQSERMPVAITASQTPDAIPVSASTKNFEKFSHDVEEHKQFACVTCHEREGKSTKIDLAGHESCVGCHLNQFVGDKVTEENKAMCSICHSALDSSDPPVRAFPVKFLEGFNMKFDHGAHERGEGRPAQGCTACHSPSGPGQSIPSGIDTHSTCYACHTAEKKIGTCNVCHELAPYRRTTQSQYNFKALFRHGDHRGVGCNECHDVRPGAPQGRQVSNIQILQHRAAPGTNCLACHNGRRAFSGNNPFAVDTCVRCHQGMASAQIPSGASLPADTVPEQ